MRRISPAIAAISSLAGFGLGYVYVGRIRLAFILLAAIVLVLSLAGWLRLVFHPQLLYFSALVALLIGLFPVFHSARIAYLNRDTPARRYNKPWVYAAWVLGSWFVSQGIIALRPVVFGFESFRLPASSMAPLLEAGDYVMADTWRFNRVEPAYGDLVVFDLPDQVGVKYVKRLVGLPGDIIEIRENVLHRNGRIVEEPFIRLEPDASDSLRDFGPAEMPESSYFMLGDNRHNSRDSRFIGPINRELLHGRLEIRWFSYDDGIRWDRFPERLTLEGK